MRVDIDVLLKFSFIALLLVASIALLGKLFA